MLKNAVRAETDDGVFFYQQEGLLYRQWHLRCQPKDWIQACEQLVLPKCFRQPVLQLAHDLPTAGHLGVTKTTKRILQQYYGPGIFKDVTDYCRTCEVCQRGQVKCPSKAQMVPMPLIQKQIQRIAIDLVGPLPKS